MLFSKEEYNLGILSFLSLDLTVVAFCLRLAAVTFGLPDQISDRFYVISMEFLSLSRRRPPWPNVLSGEEQGETAVFACYFSENSGFFLNVVVHFYAFSHHMTLTSQTSNASRS